MKTLNATVARESECYRKRRDVIEERRDLLEDLRKYGFEKEAKLAEGYYGNGTAGSMQTVLAEQHTVSYPLVSVWANAVIHYLDPTVSVSRSAQYRAEKMRKVVTAKRSEEQKNTELGLGHLPTDMPKRMMQALEEIIRARRNKDFDYLELRLQKSLILTFGLDDMTNPQYRGIRKVAALLSATYYQVQYWIELAKEQLRKKGYRV